MGLFDLFKRKKKVPSVKITTQYVECEAVGKLSKIEKAIPSIEFVPATDRQKEYANDLGIVFPSDISKSDLSCLISRAVGDDSIEGPSDDMVDLALRLDVSFSPYIGKDGLLANIMFSASSENKAALYAYAIFQSLNKRPFGNMFADDHADVFKSFGVLVASDQSLIKSLNDRPSKELEGPRKGTNIYNAALKYMQENGII